MKERSLTEAEVLDLASREESHFFDNKASRVSGRGIQKISVAFANADGGEFVVGIKDEKEELDPALRWDGVPTVEDLNSIFQNLSETQPQVPHQIEVLRHPDDSVAARIFVEKSESVHRTADGTVYVRKGAQSLPLNDHGEIQALSYAKGESSYEDTLVAGAHAEDIFETDEMRRFLESYSPSTDPIDFTINQNLVDRRSYDPRTAGILLFSDNPVPLLPRRCGIKISRYDTDLDVPERDHLKEQYTIEGALHRQINEAADRITQIMEAVKVMTPSGLESAKYPPETIWELLVNAVIHRDYSISDDIHVLVFNNRIEISSPGRLPGYVTVQNILDSRFSRNSKIVRMLNKYADAPNRDMGEGINTAFQKMEEFRLQPPVISERSNTVLVVIPHTPLASPQEQVMEFLEHNEIIKNRQAREVTGIKSENSMKRVFYDLRDNHLIEPVYSKNGNRIVAWKKFGS
jgi:ATP-dependent DNA helicase RecG